MITLLFSLIARDAPPLKRTGAMHGGEYSSPCPLDVLPQARRWRPLLHDVNSLPNPETVAGWVRRGLDGALRQVR